MTNKSNQENLDGPTDYYKISFGYRSITTTDRDAAMKLWELLTCSEFFEDEMTEASPENLPRRKFVWKKQYEFTISKHRDYLYEDSFLAHKAKAAYENLNVKPKGSKEFPF